MGGSIYASSIVGQGSTFSFTARLEPDMSSLAESIESELTPTIQPRRILLAEDGLVNQKVAIGLLEKRGHQVELAENGVEALRALSKSHYDVVLMDIQMPEMDGLTAVRQIRQDEVGTGRRQRVIALTAHAMSGDQERFLKAGMDGHLPKPFKPQDLYAAVEQYPAIESQRPHQSDSTQLGVLDRDVALSTTGGDKSLAAVLLETCMEETPKMIASARQSILDESWTDARRWGHSMKSSFGAIGALAAAACCKDLEFATTETTAHFQNALASIENEFQRLKAHLDGRSG
jgi:CheY-like chemotaxis protein